MSALPTPDPARQPPVGPDHPAPTPGPGSDLHIAPTSAEGMPAAPAVIDPRAKDLRDATGPGAERGLVPGPVDVRSIDGRSLAIGILSVTACVLLVGFLLLTRQPTPALAVGQHDRGGDYVLLTQQLSNSQEGVVVIDAASRRMTVYGFDINAKRIGIIHDNIPLDRLPGSAPPPAEQDGDAQRGRP